MTVLAYFGAVWLFCSLLMGAAAFCGWVSARVEIRNRDRPPTDTRPTTGPLLRRLADEGAEILARERSER